MKIAIISFHKNIGGYNESIIFSAFENLDIIKQVI